ncbi:MAG: hypothetical protein HC921_18385 [Synechococcaceae cyanobacterium SM2_3_1]|nr:hypothetical protein [Synechococcaceae cyanobacterium SM2_3_1]
MLIELRPEEADEMLPIAPTWEQYVEYWSDPQRSTGRILTSLLVGGLLLLLSRLFTEDEVGFFGAIVLLGGFLALLYPFLFGPLYVIGRRNLAFRDIPYTGLFFGKVLRLRRLTVLVEERERMDEAGELYIEEIRERQLEIEIGDETGLTFMFRVPNQPRYDAIVKQQSVLALVKSTSADLQQRPALSEIYVVKLQEWVGNTSYLIREKFLDLANQVLDEVQ